MFDVSTTGDTAHIDTIFKFLPHTRQRVWQELDYSQPAPDTATNTELQLPEVVVIQFVSPDDEHDVLVTCRVL